MTMTTELVAQHGLTADEYQRIVEALGREPTLTELGIFSVMWSEHCSYKSSRVHLKTLPTTGTRVLQGPGENAGAVDIGDGLAAVFKIESHNHPSFIEPYQGAATGVGGIIRDIFTMGARPIALLNSLRFGSLEEPLVRRTMGVSLPESPDMATASASRPLAERSDSTRATRGTRWSTSFALARRRRAKSSRRSRQAPAIPCITSAPRRDAMGSTARRWPRPSSTTSPPRNGRPYKIG